MFENLSCVSPLHCRNTAVIPDKTEPHRLVEHLLKAKQWNGTGMYYYRDLKVCTDVHLKTDHANTENS